jgi:hypothetical protein
LLAGKKVLIVEDKADVLEALEELLSECEVERAVNPDPAAGCQKSHNREVTVFWAKPRGEARIKTKEELRGGAN